MKEHRTHLAALASAALALALAAPARAASSVEDFSWGFKNFDSTDQHSANCPGIQPLDWNLYGATYIGAPSSDPGPGVDELVFNDLYSTKLAKDGNCYGMALMSLLLRVKGSHMGFCGTPATYSGDLQGGNCVKGDSSGNGPDDPQLRRVINIMSGYQMNLNSYNYYVSLGAAGIQDATVAYDTVDSALQAGAPGVLLSISPDLTGSAGGHTVLAYRTDPNDNQTKYIYVYDVNHPYQTSDWQNYYLLGLNRVTIHVQDKSWEYAKDVNADYTPDGPPWSGGPAQNLGSVILSIPVEIAAKRDVSIAELPDYTAATAAHMLLTGASASVAQVTDSQGRRLLVPGTHRLESDPQAAIGNIVPVVPFAGAATPGLQGWCVLGPIGDALDIQVNSGATGYRLDLGAPRGVVSVATQSGAGAGDRLRVRGMGSREPAVLLYNPYGRSDYSVQFIQVLQPSQHTRIFTVDGILTPRNAPLEFQVAQRQAALLVASPMAGAQFNLHVTDLNQGVARSADFTALAVGTGQSLLAGPSDWANPSNAPLATYSQPLPFVAIEGYVDAMSQPGQGPPGPQLANGRDVGSATNGQTSFDPNALVYTQLASGTNIGNGGDAFQFAYGPLAGDFICEVQITAPPTNPAAIYGLMARQDCSPTAKYSFLQPFAWTYRVTQADDQSTDASETFSPDPIQPAFLRLVRYGLTLYGFVSSDGVVWQPVGADTWYGADPAGPLAVGFASAANGQPFTTQFAIRRFESLNAPPLAPITDDGVSAGWVITSYLFPEPDGSPPGDFSVQSRDGTFVPNVQGGRLRITDAAAPLSSSSAFARWTIDDVDSIIYQFDFDLFLTPPPGAPPAGGVTFALAAGKDPTPVGYAGGALGYQGLGHDPASGRNVSRNGVAVEFEFGPGTGHNEGTGPYHVGLDAQNSVSSLVVAPSNAVPNLVSGNGVHVRVAYNAGMVRAFLRDASATTGPLVQVLEASALPLSYGRTDGTAVFGFTGGTGTNGVTAEIANLVVTGIKCNELPNVALIDGVPSAPVAVGATVTLDGSRSHSGATNAPPPVTLVWSVVSTNAYINGPDSGPTVNIIATAPGPVTVSLAADDGRCGTPGVASVTFQAIIPAPPPSLGFAQGPQGLLLTWAGGSSNSLYTVETTPSLSQPLWLPVPGATWPTNLTQWLIPSLNSTSGFYRVKVMGSP